MDEDEEAEPEKGERKAAHDLVGAKPDRGCGMDERHDRPGNRTAEQAERELDMALFAPAVLELATYL